MKLKEKIYNLYSTLKKSTEKFPLTISTILVLTVIYAINLDNDYIKENTLINITLFGGIFASSNFFIETIMENKSKKRILYCIISAIISVIFTYASNIDSNFCGMENEIFLGRLARLIVCYLISSVVLSIYFNYKKSNKTFEEYTRSIFINIFKSSVVYGILSIGIATITAIFIYLILDGDDYTLIARMEILLLGIYYIPTIIYSFYNVEEEIAKFAKIIIKYVLGTLLITAFIIIYMYIVKIIVLRDMPSNQIFRILAILFILGCPIWTMIGAFKEEQIIDKVNVKLPLLFIPFIILQIYSIFVRIENNGITESRYLCIMLIIFEIIYTLIYLKKKEKIGLILLVFIVLTMISSIIPYINMFKISELSQYNNLKIYKQKTDYTQEDKDKIYGAYYYLKYSEQGEKYINKVLTTDEQEQIKKFKTSNIKHDKNEYVSASTNVEYINIDGYKKLYNIEARNYNVKNKNIDEIFKNLELKLENNQKIIYIDILSNVRQYIENEENLQRNFETMNEIQFDNNKKMIIKSFHISYNEVSEEVESYSIDGYLLEK